MLTSQILKGRVALVTGSASGIGRGIIQSLSEAGATTVMHGLVEPKELEARAEALRQQTGNVVTTADTDLTDPDKVSALIADVQNRHGKLDILVNNAGIQFVAPVVDFPVDKWKAITAILMDAPFYASKAALPAMIESGWGRIVNTGSMHALVASPYKSAYNAAKHGVAGFTKTLALEVATSGVTVNAVCPGYVMTELIERQLEGQAKSRGIPVEDVIDAMLIDQPIRRFVKPSEVGAMVRHLCTDDAAAITGACLSVDGGWVAR